MLFFKATPEIILSSNLKRRCEKMSLSKPSFVRKHIEVASSSPISPIAEISSWRDRFTATGEPMPQYTEPSAWEKACPWGLQAPILPPFGYTDQTVMLVPVRLQEDSSDDKVYPSDKPRTSMIRRMKKLGMPGSRSKPCFTCVYMPRSEYLSRFAHDSDGRYIGTAPERSWTREELDEEFGQYRDAPVRRWVKRQEGDRVYMAIEEDLHVY
ncbi:hypothetical protein B0O99DRAFT_691039 [Bisporella sp. PMI_857]|nr:hypothetical protein B0O99DRAFT_691039 [Bisporella sp. PMI_857]